MAVSNATRAFLNSFADPSDAFAFLGGSTFAETRAREVELACACAPPPSSADQHANSSSERLDFLSFDVETDGAKGGQLAIQLGYCVFDQEGNEIFSREELLRLPKDRRVQYGAYKIHKISDNKLKLKGVHARPEIELFFEWVDRVVRSGGKVLAHNARFDAAVISNTAKFNGIDRSLSASECFCTMRNSTLLAGLRNKKGGLKWPKNAELYAVLHEGAQPTWAALHSALSDSRVTARSYLAGKQRGWW
tara:strand:- start:172 stop:918 length:747 start_codon:yes stop_codon:yes gene_type:complete